MRVPTWAQQAIDCRPGDPGTANFGFQWKALPNSCFLATGGFSDDAGSFAAFSALGGNYLDLSETLDLGLQYGVRTRAVQLGLTKPLVPDNHIQAGFALFAQRFRYDQDQEASLLAFSRTVTEGESLDPGDRLKYVSHRYGGESFVRVAFRDGVSSLKLSYSLEVTGVRALTAGTSDYFSQLRFLSGLGPNRLSGIVTSRVAAAYLRSTVDHPLRPSHGMMFSASLGLAGLGGDVDLVEPSVEAKWFHPGLSHRHVIATHWRGSILSGFDGKAAPPFDRDYMGGEQEIRGFSSWALTPVAFAPGNVPIAIGGDTKLVGNVEYRIPLYGPLTLALFTDAGIDRAVFTDQLQWNGGGAERLIVQPASERPKMSSGAELQVLFPKIQAPVRFYWAYNELACTGGASCGLLRDPRSMLRIAIGFAF